MKWAILGPVIIALFAALYLVATPPHVEAASCVPAVASYYGTESGSRTANGERFDGSGMTAAHRTWPFGTRVRVTYHGKSVVVRINDRGPYIRGRSIDLSRAAAKRIGLVNAGVGKVCLERLN